jgi:ABC-2 type transport system ATP-binding protein
MPEHEIVVDHLVKKFDTMAAVDDVSFNVEPGELFAFLGPNGAGKTTTINILVTILKPTAGRALVNGFDVVTQQAQVRQSIGIVFQDPSLDDRLSGWQNLHFHALVYNMSESEGAKRIEQLMRMVDLWEVRNHEVRSYSGGMRRRLELARGLLHHPKVLFLDEPTIGLDPQTRDLIWRYILEMRKEEGTTIFMTTHYMEEAEKVDRVAIIDHGKIIALDTPDVLKRMVGKDVVTGRTDNCRLAASEIERKYNLTTRCDDASFTFEVESGEEFLPGFIRDFGPQILSISLHRPTLEDVFLKLTGREIRESEGGSAQLESRMRHTAGSRR